jgi:hypothetical protein
MITVRMGSDLAAAAGVIIIWLVVLLAAVWYGLAVLKPPDPDADPGAFLECIRTGFRKFTWLVPAIGFVIPGLWIGGIAQHPVPIALGYFAIHEIVHWLNDAVPCQLPLPRQPFNVTQRLLLVGMLLAASQLGVEIRGLLVP